MGAREELRAVAVSAIAGALLSLRCGSDSALGEGQEAPAPSTGGATGTGGSSPQGGNAGAPREGSSGRGSGGDASGGARPSGGAGPDGGGADPDGGAVGPVPVPGDCVAKKDLPASCSEVCLDQGKQCSEDCDFGTALPGRAAYYSDILDCQNGGPLTFVETAKCDSRFDPGDFLPYAGVRCCCTASDFAVATSAEKAPLCTAACAQDPYPPVAECETLSCGDYCLEVTRGVDLACARCLIGKVTFMPSGCGARECICGGPSFPDSSSTLCTEECAASRQHDRDVYAAKPRPAPVGTPPAAHFDLENTMQITALRVDGQGKLWAAGRSFDPTGPAIASVALFDADLHLLWKWDDPGKRQTDGVAMTVHAGGVVVALNLSTGSAPLAFFDSSGFLREVPTSARSPDAVSSFGDALLVKHSGPFSKLTVFETTGAERLTADAASFDGFSGHWVHTAADGVFTLIDDDTSVQWRRVTVSASATSVAWTRQLALVAPTRGISFTGAGPGGGQELLAWGARYEPRGNLDRGYPLVMHLADDGSVPWQWSNGSLITPGAIADAVVTARGLTCGVGKESWEFSTADVPTSGPLCSPDGCEALTVRCLDANAQEVFRYHHRSELSDGTAMAADASGRLFVVATFTRDPRLSTGTRSALLRFDP